jgi:protein SCO1/2
MFRKVFVSVCFTVLIACSFAAAHSTSEQHPHSTASSDAGESSSSNIVNLKVPDLELINQDGEKGRFVSDIIGDRLAAVTFTYTNCATACPVLDGIFKKVQQRLGEEMGKETILITLSIDPVTDIPPRLKARAEKIKAKPGWYFLTGKKQTVNRVLKALEVYSPDIFNHPPTVFVVDGKRGVWSRINGFPFTGKVVKVMDEFRIARADK